jgi:hypothetical protein
VPLASEKPQRTPDGVLTRESMEQIIMSGRSFQFNRRTISRMEDIPGEDELVDVGAQTEDAAMARLEAQQARLNAEFSRVERRTQRQRAQVQRAQQRGQQAPGAPGGQRGPGESRAPQQGQDESLALPPYERDPETERVGQPGSQLIPRGQQSMVPERPIPEGQAPERHPVQVAGMPRTLPGQPSDPERQPDQPGTRQPDPGPGQVEQERGQEQQQGQTRPQGQQAQGQRESAPASKPEAGRQAEGGQGAQKGKGR